MECNGGGRLPLVDIAVTGVLGNGPNELQQYMLGDTMTVPINQVCDLLFFNWFGGLYCGGE